MILNKLFRSPDAGDGGTLIESSPEQQEALKAEAYDGDVLKPGYTLDDTGYIIKTEPLQEPEDPQEPEDSDSPEDPQDPQDPDSPDENPLDFFKAVESITGIEVPVEYGDVDPVSPQGVALREQRLMDLSAQKFEDYLKTTFPDAFAFFLHRQMGGTKEEFFQESIPTVPEKNTFEQSAEMQANMVRLALLERGVPEEVADATIESYIKSDTLTEKALQLYDEYEKAQANQLKNIQRIQNEQKAKFDLEVKNTMDIIDTAVDQNAIKFVVPDAKKPEFKNYVKEMIRYSDGQFYIAQPLLAENTNKVLEALFLQFSGNSLKDIIEKESRTLTAQKLKLRAQKDSNTQKGSGANAKPAQQFLTLSDIMPTGY